MTNERTGILNSSNRRLKAELQNLRRRGALRAERTEESVTRACARCRAELGRIINRGAPCRACRLRVCKQCREYSARGTDWVCSVCQKHIELQAATGEWMNEFVRRPSRRRDHRVFVPGGDIVKRSIRRSWTISHPGRPPVNISNRAYPLGDWRHADHAPDENKPPGNAPRPMFSESTPTPKSGHALQPFTSNIQRELRRRHEGIDKRCDEEFEKRCVGKQAQTPPPRLRRRSIDLSRDALMSGEGLTSSPLARKRVVFGQHSLDRRNLQPLSRNIDQQCPSRVRHQSSPSNDPEELPNRREKSGGLLREVFAKRVEESPIHSQFHHHHHHHQNEPIKVPPHMDVVPSSIKPAPVEIAGSPPKGSCSSKEGAPCQIPETGEQEERVSPVPPPRKRSPSRRGSGLIRRSSSVSDSGVFGSRDEDEIDDEKEAPVECCEERLSPEAEQSFDVEPISGTVFRKVTIKRRKQDSKEECKAEPGYTVVKRSKRTTIRQEKVSVQEVSRTVTILASPRLGNRQRGSPTLVWVGGDGGDSTTPSPPATLRHQGISGIASGDCSPSRVASPFEPSSSGYVYCYSPQLQRSINRKPDGGNDPLSSNYSSLDVASTSVNAGDYVCILDSGKIVPEGEHYKLVFISSDSSSKGSNSDADANSILSISSENSQNTSPSPAPPMLEDESDVEPVSGFLDDSDCWDYFEPAAAVKVPSVSTTPVRARKMFLGQYYHHPPSNDDDDTSDGSPQPAPKFGKSRPIDFSNEADLVAMLNQSERVQAEARCLRNVLLQASIAERQERESQQQQKKKGKDTEENEEFSPEYLNRHFSRADSRRSSGDRSIEEVTFSDHFISERRDQEAFNAFAASGRSLSESDLQELFPPEMSADDFNEWQSSVSKGDALIWSQECPGEKIDKSNLDSTTVCHDKIPTWMFSMDEKSKLPENINKEDEKVKKKNRRRKRSDRSEDFESKKRPSLANMGIEVCHSAVNKNETMDVQSNEERTFVKWGSATLPRRSRPSTSITSVVPPTLSPPSQFLDVAVDTVRVADIIYCSDVTDEAHKNSVRIRIRSFRRPSVTQVFLTNDDTSNSVKPPAVADNIDEPKTDGVTANDTIPINKENHVEGEKQITDNVIECSLVNERDADLTSRLVCEDVDNVKVGDKKTQVFEPACAEFKTENQTDFDCQEIENEPNSANISEALLALEEASNENNYFNDEIQLNLALHSVDGEPGSEVKDNEKIVKNAEIGADGPLLIDAVGAAPVTASFGAGEAKEKSESGEGASDLAGGIISVSADNGLDQQLTERDSVQSIEQHSEVVMNDDGDLMTNKCDDNDGDNEDDDDSNIKSDNVYSDDSDSDLSSSDEESKFNTATRVVKGTSGSYDLARATCDSTSLEFGRGGTVISYEISSDEYPSIIENVGNDDSSTSDSSDTDSETSGQNFSHTFVVNDSDNDVDVNDSASEIEILNTDYPSDVESSKCDNNDEVQVLSSECIGDKISLLNDTCCENNNKSDALTDVRDTEQNSNSDFEINITENGGEPSSVSSEESTPECDRVVIEDKKCTAIETTIGDEESSLGESVNLIPEKTLVPEEILPSAGEVVNYESTTPGISPVSDACSAEAGRGETGRTSPQVNVVPIHLDSEAQTVSGDVVGVSVVEQSANAPETLTERPVINEQINDVSVVELIQCKDYSTSTVVVDEPQLIADVVNEIKQENGVNKEIEENDKEECEIRKEIEENNKGECEISKGIEENDERECKINNVLECKQESEINKEIDENGKQECETNNAIEGKQESAINKEIDENGKQFCETNNAIEENGKQDCEINNKEIGENGKQECEINKNTQEVGKQDNEISKEIEENGTQECEINKETEENGKLDSEIKKEIGVSGKQESEIKKETEENGKLDSETNREIAESGNQESEIKKETEENGKLDSEIKKEIRENGIQVSGIKTETEEDGKVYSDINKQIGESGKHESGIKKETEDNGKQQCEINKEIEEGGKDVEPELSQRSKPSRTQTEGIDIETKYEGGVKVGTIDECLESEQIGNLNASTDEPEVVEHSPSTSVIEVELPALQQNNGPEGGGYTGEQRDVITVLECDVGNDGFDNKAASGVSTDVSVSVGGVTGESKRDGSGDVISASENVCDVSDGDKSDDDFCGESSGESNNVLSVRNLFSEVENIKGVSGEADIKCVVSEIDINKREFEVTRVVTPDKCRKSDSEGLSSSGEDRLESDTDSQDTVIEGAAYQQKLSRFALQQRIALANREFSHSPSPTPSNELELSSRESTSGPNSPPESKREGRRRRYIPTSPYTSRVLISQDSTTTEEEEGEDEDTPVNKDKVTVSVGESTHCMPSAVNVVANENTTVLSDVVDDSAQVVVKHTYSADSTDLSEIIPDLHKLVQQSREASAGAKLDYKEPTGLATYFTLTLETGLSTTPKKPEVRKTVRRSSPPPPPSSPNEEMTSHITIPEVVISDVTVVTGGDTMSAVVDTLSDIGSAIDIVEASVDDDDLENAEHECIIEEEVDFDESFSDFPSDTEFGDRMEGAEELDSNYSESASSGDEAYFDREEELRGYNRAIDFTLHTIIEESCEESECEYKPNEREKKRQSDPSELEKYFYFGLGNGQNDANKKIAHEEGDHSDSISETSSSIFSEGVESLEPEGDEEEDPADYASSRLEKYFKSTFRGFQGLGDFSGQHSDESGSVGSDSEGHPSPEQRRKKYLTRQRGSGMRHSDRSESLGSDASFVSSCVDEERSAGDGEGSTDTDSNDEMAFEKNDGQFDTIKRQKKQSKKHRNIPPTVIMSGHNTPENLDRKQAVESLDKHEKKSSSESSNVKVGSVDNLRKVEGGEVVDGVQTDKTDHTLPLIESASEDKVMDVIRASSSSPASLSDLDDGSRTPRPEPAPRKFQSRDSGFVGSCDDLIKESASLDDDIDDAKEASEIKDVDIKVIPTPAPRSTHSSDGSDSEGKPPDDRGAPDGQELPEEPESSKISTIEGCIPPVPARRSSIEKNDPSKMSRSSSVGSADVAISPVPLPRTKLTRKDSFNNWSSDEETNLMMSKMRAFFKNMISTASRSSSGSEKGGDGKSKICNPAKVKSPQLVYFENELTRLMKTVPGINDEQVREIVEYLSSEDTWSDSYDSSDYTSSDLEGAYAAFDPTLPNLPLKTDLQEQISASCQEIIQKFNKSVEVDANNVDAYRARKLGLLAPPDQFGDDSSSSSSQAAGTQFNRDTAIVYQRLMASFNKVAAQGSLEKQQSSSEESTPHSSPPLIAKVMHHIGSRLVALMHEMSSGAESQGGGSSGSSTTSHHHHHHHRMTNKEFLQHSVTSSPKVVSARYRRPGTTSTAAAMQWKRDCGGDSSSVEGRSSLASTSFESEDSPTDTEQSPESDDNNDAAGIVKQKGEASALTIARLRELDRRQMSPDGKSSLSPNLLPRSRSHDLGSWQHYVIEEGGLAGRKSGTGGSNTNSAGRDMKESLRSSSSGVSDIAEEREDERFSWRGSFESALAADSRTKLSIEAKRRSAGSGSGSGSVSDFFSSSDQLDRRGRVRSCGSISSGSRTSLHGRARLSASGDLLAYTPRESDTEEPSGELQTYHQQHQTTHEKWRPGGLDFLTRRRRSVPDTAGITPSSSAPSTASSPSASVVASGASSTGDPINGARSITLPRSNTVMSASTNSLPRLPLSSSSSPGGAIHKSQSMLVAATQRLSGVMSGVGVAVKSARYRPPGFRPPPAPPKRAVSAPGLQIAHKQRRTSPADDGSLFAEASPLTGPSPGSKSSSPSPVIGYGGAGRGSVQSMPGSDWSGQDDDIDNIVAMHQSKGNNSLSPLGPRSESLASVYSAAGEGRYGSVPVRGEVEFGLQYNYKQAALEILVKQCRDLAAVDSKRNRSDPYVKVYLLPDKSKSGKRKTKVKKHTLNPVFDETLKFHITLHGLETRTLWVTVWHSDMFGRNDFLGEVMIPLENKVFDDPTPKWYTLQERTEPFDDQLSYKGDLIVALKFVPPDVTVQKKGKRSRGALHVLVKEAKNLTAVKANGSSDPFCKSYLLPEKGRSSKQKTPVVKRSVNPTWNYTFVYEDVSLQELSERSLELTVWDHDRLASNEFLGGLRFNLGSGKHYGKMVDWMDASGKEVTLWQSMLERPNFWVEGSLVLRPTLENRVQS